MIDNILFLNRIYTPAIPKEPLFLLESLPVTRDDPSQIARTASASQPPVASSLKSG
ncbi:hypothetical protein BN874_1380001 [Candidatus Contendobacter odensis Run_B_J11]|uniref:Uncharacterized protein n=1 Tax=Candidatus Contendobacter odensis Run_B_J11 TaxID=1400861 RepID=A0A7U7G9W1_9GAMM|nr:hypothetical protein BN874_1380001 [Candidatus Contendobacter odensis Run_B_J11]